ncbi:HEPN domain-containing protein [Marinicella gelatinilytica]|uniref:hypothetical protein n=1 Tax=Marinicella gelatinilytica TaxID=2996017 RepID=UPI002260DC13|nr:hypothetical protein [Marinicella gelatinilytica]MCX7545000.1 hypothetical protein [Marinicella gelatinilytica]
MGPLEFENPEIDGFAIRTFRDTADLDYIAARLCYRSGLIPQFHWQSLQCIEKYFKTILLLNRIKCTERTHSLKNLYDLSVQLPFELFLSPSSDKLIEHLDKFGTNRYFNYSYYVDGPKLVLLDKCVWEIRHYCYQMNYSIFLDGEYRSQLNNNVNLIRTSHNNFKNSKKIPNVNGKLEEIVANKEYFSRKALIWQNAFFGLKNRNVVKQKIHFIAENPPLSLNPDLLEEIEKYIFLPKHVCTAYRNIKKPK